MRNIKKWLIAVCLGLVASASFAAADVPQLGKEYKNLRQAQATNAGDKIEIMAFFAFYCPHCYALEPTLEAWVKKNSSKIVFKRFHAFNPGVEAQQRLFLTLDAMGKADEYMMKAFEAYHIKRNRLMTEAQVNEFVATTKLDKKVFNDTYKSFSVQMKQNRSMGVMTQYEIDSWPTMIVDGRFQTSPAMAVTGKTRINEQIQNESLLPVLDFLVEKAINEKAKKK